MALSHILKTWDSTPNHMGFSPIIPDRSGSFLFVKQTSPRQNNSNRETWGLFHPILTLVISYNLITPVITGFWGPTLPPPRLPSTCTAIRQCAGGKDRRKSRAKRTSEGLGGSKRSEAVRICPIESPVGPSSGFGWMFTCFSQGWWGRVSQNDGTGLRMNFTGSMVKNHAFFFWNGRFFTPKNIYRVSRGIKNWR